MTPSFDEIVEWLKSAEPGQPFPKVLSMPLTQQLAAVRAAGIEGVSSEGVSSEGISSEGISSEGISSEGIYADMTAGRQRDAASSRSPVAMGSAQPENPVLQQLSQRLAAGRLAEGIVLMEILDRPLAKRGRTFGRRRW